MGVAQRSVQTARRERPKPQFIARAKVGNGWQTIGAAWPLRSGEPGFSVKLNTLPVGAWEGQFVLLPPLDNGEDPEPRDE